MTLPEVCPRDGVSRCKKADCHLYVIDWRSGDEQCIIGYSSTHKKMSRSSPVVDTYAERTRLKRETKKEQSSVRQAREWPSPETRSHEERSWDSRSSDSKPSRPLSSEVRLPELSSSEKKLHSEEESDVQDQIKDRFQETVVSSDKNTTLIESSSSSDKGHSDQKKRKSIDDVMNLDLPDNYEEEFWKK